jgi:outer membrane cobalamin receptor
METHRTAAFGRLARHILLSASAIAIAASAANAQDVETVVVSGSRLVTNGAQAPTPVTVVSSEQLQVAAPRNIVDGLLQLPAFKGSVSVQNQSTGTTSSNGADYLNLRGLGPSRTLVLLDGRRVVPASSAGSVDAAQMPEALIQRVDVVTGGASAAYGSDAVAGVVNFILDTKFEGLKASAQAGISQYGDNFNYRVSVTGGMSFLSDRLHVVGSILDYKSNGVSLAQRPALDRDGACSRLHHQSQFQQEPARFPNQFRTAGCAPALYFGRCAGRTDHRYHLRACNARQHRPCRNSVRSKRPTRSVQLRHLEKRCTDVGRRRIQPEPAANLAAFAAPLADIHARDL